MKINLKIRTVVTVLFSFVLVGSFLFAKSQGQNFHGTTTKVDYNSASKKVNISMKFFTDDIRKTTAQNETDPSFENALSQYITRNFKIKVNDADRNLRLIGINSSAKTIWGYFEILNISQVKSIEIRNELLLNFPGERNIMNFSVNGQRKSVVGNSKKRTFKVTF